MGILLTGMSADGPKGLLNMREAGTVTIAQDKRSSVVYGMLKVAVELGAAQHNAALAAVPRTVVQSLKQRDTKP